MLKRKGRLTTFGVKMCRCDTAQIAAASAESGKYVKSRRGPSGGGQKPVLQETEAPKQETEVFYGEIGRGYVKIAWSAVSPHMAKFLPPLCRGVKSYACSSPLGLTRFVSSRHKGSCCHMAETRREHKGWRRRF